MASAGPAETGRRDAESFAGLLITPVNPRYSLESLSGNFLHFLIPLCSSVIDTFQRLPMPTLLVAILPPLRMQRAKKKLQAPSGPAAKKKSVGENPLRIESVIVDVQSRGSSQAAGLFKRWPPC